MNEFSVVNGVLSSIVICLLAQFVSTQRRIEKKMDDALSRFSERLERKIDVEDVVAMRAECRDDIAKDLNALERKVCSMDRKNESAHSKFWEALHRHTHTPEGDVVRRD